MRPYARTLLRLFPRRGGGPFGPAPVRLLLDFLRRRFDHRLNFPKEGDDRAQLTRRKVRGLRTLSRTGAELNPIIVVHADRGMKHVYRAEGLCRTAQTVVRIALQSVDKGGRIRS